MANGLVSLGYLRLQAQQRSGMENNPAISTTEWNQYISNSYKELYDLLVAAYGNDYYVALPYQFSLTGAQTYGLPDGSTNFLINSAAAPAFYQLLGVDLQYSGSPTGWVTLKNYEFVDRNKYQYPNTTANYSGFSNLRYRLQGNQLSFIPVPAASQVARMWYIPQPTNLIFAPTCATTSGSAVITASDVQGLAVGMSVYASQGILSGTTILSINAGASQVTLSANATLTQAVAVVLFWSDATTIDGIAGWEEYVIIDAILKGVASEKIPIENPVLLEGQLKKMKDRIEAMAKGRDAGQAHHVSDALSLGGAGDGFDDGFGGMSGAGFY